MKMISLLLSSARAYVRIYYTLNVVGGAIIAYTTYKAIHKVPKYFNYRANFVLKIWDMIVYRIEDLKVK